MMSSMPMYVDKFYSSRSDGQSRSEIYEVYSQPARYHIARSIVSFVSWRLDGLLHAVDPIAYRVHRIRCKDTCGTRRDLDSSGAAVKTYRSCTWVSLCAQMSMYEYVLGQRERVVLCTAR